MKIFNPFKISLFFLSTLVCLLTTSPTFAGSEISLDTGAMNTSYNFNFGLTLTPQDQGQDPTTVILAKRAGTTSPYFGLSYRYLFQDGKFFIGPELGYQLINNKLTEKAFEGKRLSYEFSEEFKQAINLSAYLGYLVTDETRIYFNAGISNPKFEYHILENAELLKDVEKDRLFGLLLKAGVTTKITGHFYGSVGLQYMRYRSLSYSSSLLDGVLVTNTHFQNTTLAGTVTLSYTF